MAETPSVLLIEDTAELANAIVKDLTAAGFVVRHAARGERGLAAFASDPADVIVLDWMLPDIDGLEVLRRLRQSSAVPVLMLTARAEEVDRVIGLEVGADDYLTKPFGMRELQARLRALLRRHERLAAQLEADRSADGVVRWGHLELDAAGHRARLDGEQLDLTPTEFGLLHLMARHPGRTFARSYLHETVWKEPFLPGERSVDNAILRLRRKLGETASAIEAVWGVGYRLREP